MALNEPVSWEAALEYLQERRLLPTELGSKALQGVEAEIRRRAIFSARVTNLELLQGLKDEVKALLTGEYNEATARAKIQDLLDGLGYDPESGFPGEDRGQVVEGGLQDLSSDKRIRLQLETNMKTTANFAFWKQGQDLESRWQYPCWELVRIGVREVPRGFKRGKGGALVDDPENAWEERWARAGGELVDGDRMVARKDDEVWEALGDSGVFEDGLDNPFPPFAFNSGMGWRAVPREEAVELGLVGEDEVPAGSEAGLNDGLKVNAEGMDQDLLRQALADTEMQIKGLELKLRGREGKGSTAEYAEYAEGEEGLTQRAQRAQRGDAELGIEQMLAVVERLCGGWNPLLHPQGADGRFIETGGAGEADKRAVHPLDEESPLSHKQGIALLKKYPEHPTTKVAKEWFEGDYEKLARDPHSPESQRLLRFAERLPASGSNEILYRGMGWHDQAARDEHFQKAAESGEYVNHRTFMSASKDQLTAAHFMVKYPHKGMLVITEHHSSRDLQPIAEEISPKFAHQRENVFLFGSKFKVAGTATHHEPGAPFGTGLVRSATLKESR